MKAAIMRKSLAAIRIGIVAFLLNLPTPVAAGPFEDGWVALRRGDEATAIRLWRPLGDSGDARARFFLGFEFLDGNKVPRLQAEAVSWFREAADQGHAWAQCELGRAYIYGKGVEHNDAEAAVWFLKAAKQGYVYAQVNLGVMYERGQGVPQNYVEAVRWWRKAGEQGDAISQTYLALSYERGKGTVRDQNEAIRWYRKAAEQGNVQAQANLGRIYFNGQGVPKDYAEAASWLHKAADQGYAIAQGGLAFMYRDGQGVLKDDVTALAWAVLAISNTKQEDKDLLRLRDGIESKVTLQQRVQAHNLARQWMTGSSSVNKEANSDKSHLHDKNELTQSIVAPPRKLRQSDPPVIFAGPVPPTTAQAIDLAGRVSSKGRITSLLIDGTDVPVKPDGSFSVRRGLPLGVSEIRLTATDEWGQASEARVTVTRAAVSTDTVVASLAPDRFHGKSRPSAIALIIGIEQYKSVPPAEFAENDARRFYDYAINALGVPASRVKLLTGADAQRVDVEAAILTWLKPQVVKGQTEVFVFFSGHGLASDDGKDLYLLPQDGNRALLDRSALRRKELIDMIVDSGAKSATLFLDTCYSGGTRGKESLIASARPILVTAKEQAVLPNVTILAAAGNDQLSSSLAQAKHGLFSYFLMKGLEGDAAGPDRTITAAKLEAYLAEKIPAEAAKLGRSQTPQLIGDGSKVIVTW